MVYSQLHFCAGLSDETVCAEEVVVVVVVGDVSGYKFFKGNLQRVQFLFIYLYISFSHPILR
jgi:hypothetical protein